MSESFIKALNGLLSWKNLLRVGILTLFALLVIGGASSYLESAGGDNLVADFSSILNRAASGIFNGAGTSEKFIGAANVGEKSSDLAEINVPEGAAFVLPAKEKEKIDINTADSNELQKITGIGPATAQKIIDYRNTGGIFYKIEDIQNVSGIGPATFEKMKLEITVGDVTPLPIQPEQSPGAESRILDSSALSDDGGQIGTTEPVEPQQQPARKKININTASAFELDEITGVGPAIAKRIIDYRKSHGLFYKIEDIKNVSGIGNATFDKMKDEITVGNVTAPVVSEVVLPPTPEPDAEQEEREADETPEPKTPDEGPVISEIMAGADGNSDYEFIELYNPTNSPIDLTGWYIKKISSTGTESSLVVSSRFAGKIIPAGKYLLVAKEGGYNGSVPSDIGWPKSYTLAYADNKVVLYGPNGQIEEIFWSNIPVGSSFERDSWDSGDFHVQSDPTPANSQN